MVSCPNIYNIVRKTSDLQDIPGFRSLVCSPYWSNTKKIGICWIEIMECGSFSYPGNQSTWDGAGWAWSWSWCRKKVVQIWLSIGLKIRQEASSITGAWLATPGPTNASEHGSDLLSSIQTNIKRLVWLKTRHSKNATYIASSEWLASSSSCFVPCFDIYFREEDLQSQNTIGY